MKNWFFSCVLILCASFASAQTWIIDGQQTQVLLLDVSDSQALYTDGSREMTAPVTIASSVTSGNGMLKASIPWAYDHPVHDFFLVDDAASVLALSSSNEIGLRIRDLLLFSYGISNRDEGTTIDFESHLFEGGWLVDQVLNDPDAVMSRSYADARYLQKGVDVDATIPFASSLTALSGMFQAYVPWEGQTDEFFFFDGDEETMMLSKNVVVSLTVGSLRVDSSSISGHGVSVGFEDKTLFGGWKTSTVPDDNSAVMNRSYADTRYLKRSEGITVNHTVQAGDVLQIQNGIITAINP